MADVSMVLVWDELNAEREDAKRMDFIDFWTPDDYAREYVEKDADGQTDGIYSHGHPIMVELPGEKLFRVTVGVEYEPRFITYAAEAT